MPTPTQAITDLLETSVALGHKNERVQDLHEDRISRIETFLFHGNGDAMTTKVRLLSQEIQRVEERRSEAVVVVEDRLQKQIESMKQQIQSILTEVSEFKRQQHDMAKTHAAGRWQLVTAFLAALIAAAAAIFK